MNPITQSEQKFSGEFMLMSLQKSYHKKLPKAPVEVKDLFRGLIKIEPQERKIILPKKKPKVEEHEIAISYIPGVSINFELSAFCGPAILHMSIDDFKNFMNILKEIEESKPVEGTVGAKYKKMLKWEVVSDNKLERLIMYNKDIKNPISLSQYNMSSQVSRFERKEVYNDYNVKKIPVICN